MYRLGDGYFSGPGRSVELYRTWRSAGNFWHKKSSGVVKLEESFLQVPLPRYLITVTGAAGPLFSELSRYFCDRPVPIHSITYLRKLLRSGLCEPKMGTTPICCRQFTCFMADQMSRICVGSFYLNGTSRGAAVSNYRHGWGAIEKMTFHLMAFL